MLYLIPDIPATPTLAGADLFEISQKSGSSFVSKSVSGNAVLQYIQSNISGGSGLSYGNIIQVRSLTGLAPAADGSISSIFVYDSDAGYMWWNIGGTLAATSWIQH